MELNDVIEMLDRVEHLRRERGISKTDMYIQSHTSSSAISQWRSGRTQPSQTSISNLAKVLGTSPEYLVYGIKKEPSPVQGGLTDKVQALAALLGCRITDLIGEQTHGLVTRQVPRLGAIACGQPILAEQNIEGYDEVPDFVKCDFTLECKGDSMINARICDGDIVCVRQMQTVDDGQIAAVMVCEGAEQAEATLKRVRFLPDGVALWPENPAYRPLIFVGEDANRVKVLGLATHFISKIK